VEVVYAAEGCCGLEPEMPYAVDGRNVQRRCAGTITLRGGRFVTVLGRGALYLAAM
jgi:hypothetical protein